MNNVPHLGNIIGCVLSADVFARYCRSKWHESLFVCGTDEYGTATEAKALEEGISPKELCDKYYALHKGIYEWFGISTDIFGRTSTPLHTQITHEIFLSLHKNGFIVEEEIEQAYDEKAQMFLADRFIEGTCPHCKYDGARADQCEKCGKLLNFDELINPISKLSKTQPVKRRSRHLFIDLPKLQGRLTEWIDRTSKEGNWSENSVQIAKSWLAEGLRRRCITRDLKWGVPVPLPGWENKVFYVWFDAPIGYISITANLTGKWREWWQNPEGVSLYQFMGKDNVPFHTVVFPSTLIGTGEKWTLLERLSTTEFLNFEGGKFSKSKGFGVFGNDAVESGVPADVWRYYLLTNRPEKMDSDFTWKDFGEKLNNELLANIGNLVNRTLVFTQREFAGKVPEPDFCADDKKFMEGQNAQLAEVGALLEKVQLKDALHLAMHCGKEANAYFQKNEPWKAAKEDRAKCAASIYVLLHQVKDLAIALEPFVPNTSAAIFKQLNVEPKKWDDIGKLSLPVGHQLGKPEIIFRKLEQKEVAALAAKFSGKQVVAKEEPKAQPPVKQAKPAQKQVEKIPVSSIDFEVGKITAIKRHPDAEKLYVEQVLMGDGERQVVSGVVPYYKEEELLGKLVVIVKNLKPAVIRGVESRGMLLACEKDGVLEVLSPVGAKPGDKISIEGAEAGSAAALPEITIDQFLTVKLEVKDSLALADGKKMLVNGAPIKTEKVAEGKVR